MAVCPHARLNWSLRKKEAPYLFYGYWRTKDRREVVFNRAYRPIFYRAIGSYVFHWADPEEWFDVKSTVFLFDDRNPPWVCPATRQRVRRIMVNFILGRGLPRPQRRVS
ncbi:hypothetical protein [Reyranella sp.]|uniref:hypothetical protein n=1 Tax=Reyranella sp. TaxID=1929291 RepID=UPI0037835958